MTAKIANIMNMTNNITLLVIIIFIAFLIMWGSGDGNGDGKYEYESFYTLFQPYYKPTKMNNHVVPVKQYNLKFYIAPYQLKLYPNIGLFLRAFISYNYNVINIELISKQNNENILLEGIQNSADVALIPAPILYQYLDNWREGRRGREGNGIEYITSMNFQYIYVITNNDNIKEKGDLDTMRIGVGEKGQIWEMCFDELFEDYRCNKYYGSLTKMLEEMYNHKIDAILITDNSPNNIINFIKYNFYSVRIISLDGIIKFPNYLISGSKIDSRLCYELTSFIYNNSLLLDKNNDSFVKRDDLKISNGARKYYVENNMIDYKL